MGIRRTELRRSRTGFKRRAGRKVNLVFVTLIQSHDSDHYPIGDIRLESFRGDQSFQAQNLFSIPDTLRQRNQIDSGLGLTPHCVATYLLNEMITSGPWTIVLPNLHSTQIIVLSLQLPFSFDIGPIVESRRFTLLHHNRG